MTHPTIHLNGTPRERFLESFCEARDAVRVAMAALRETTPNGRDYYPQGDLALSAASAEHAARVRALQGVHDDLADLAEGVANAGSFRNPEP